MRGLPDKHKYGIGFVKFCFLLRYENWLPANIQKHNSVEVWSK